MCKRTFKVNMALFVMGCVLLMNSARAQYPFGGYDFPNAAAFADEAQEAGDPPSGAGLLPNGAASVSEALTDINLNTWVIAGGNQGLVDIKFTDNVIVNEPGDDFVVFEYGTSETYGVAVSTNGTPGGLTSMIDYTGTQAIDLDDFGMAADATVSLIRIQPNKQPGPGTGEWSADIQDVGALHSDDVPAEIPDIFDFNDGTKQGWTIAGAFDENYDGPFPSAFTYLWVDNTNYRNPPGNDPPGDSNGSISIFTMSGHGVNNLGAVWWVMQFHSPDLSSISTWQAAKGYTVEIAECMANMTSLYANLNVVVHDEDQDKDIVYWNGSTPALEHDIFNDAEAEWNHLTFNDWTAISGFPVNYTIKELFVNIWGKMNGAHTGGLYLDQVAPIVDEIPTGVPDPPSNLQVHVLSDQFHIYWQDNSDDEQGFILEHYTVTTLPVTWTVLDTLDANHTSYQMDHPALNVTHHFRVTAYNENGNSDYSNQVDATFLMSLVWIAIDAPNGEEVWSPGSIHEITWRNSLILGPSQVNIWYSTDGGSNWINPPIVSNYSNTGSYLWTIPDTPSDNCILKIADASDGSPYDLSYDPFTIGEPTEPILSVSPQTLDFGTSSASLTFDISNSGAGTLNWTVAENPDALWITSVSPESGTGSATVTVQVDRIQLSSENGTGTITVTSNGGNQDVSVSIEKEAVVLPQDWSCTENTGNNAVIILPSEINPNIDGDALMQGDYIGVFTPAGLCCGSTEWKNQNTSITVWGDDSQTPETDGFQAGENILYRVYRPSEETEWTTVVVGYSQGDGQYASDAILILDTFDATELSTITLDFNQGWNLFSINVEPIEAKVESVMTGVVDDLVILKNGAGQTYIPDYAINGIGEIDFRQGYKGYFNQTASLDVTGLPSDPATPLSLSAGWSMIGYLPDKPMDIEIALAGIADILVIVKDGSGKTYIPDYSIDQISQMHPGQGYQVYLSEAGTLTYPAESPGLPKLAQFQSNQTSEIFMEHFQFSRNTGENATVVVPKDIHPAYSDGTALADQDEIGVLTSSGLCCGAAVWDDQNTAITVWGDNSQTDKVDGFQSGDTLHFYVWRRSTDHEYPAAALFQEGAPMTYQVDGFYVLTGLIANLEAQVQIDEARKLPTKFELRQNCPNPFNPSTSISFDVPEPCFVSLKIYDLLGQEVDMLIHEHKTPGLYAVEWYADNHPSGIYLVRLEAGDFTQIIKVVLSK